MVIKAENTSFKKEFSMSGGEGGVNVGGIPVIPAKPEPAPKRYESDAKDDSLTELQQAMSLVARYGGKGTPAGAESLKVVLLKAAAALYAGVNEERLGSALAAIVLLAEESNISMEKVAHEKITRMVTG